MQGNFFDGGKVLWRQKLGKKQTAIRCLPTAAVLFAVFIVAAVLAAVISEDKNKVVLFALSFGLGAVCTAVLFACMYFTSGGSQSWGVTEYFITATRAIVSINGGKLEREINLKDVKSVKVTRFFGSKTYGTLTFITGGSGWEATSQGTLRSNGKPVKLKFSAIENAESALKIAEAAIKQCQSNVTQFDTNVF